MVTEKVVNARNRYDLLFSSLCLHEVCSVKQLFLEPSMPYNTLVFNRYRVFLEDALELSFASADGLHAIHVFPERVCLD